MTTTVTPLELLTTEEVSTLVGIPQATLRYWRHNGEGPRSAKLGGRVVYRKTDVLAWVDAAFEEEGK